MNAYVTTGIVTHKQVRVSSDTPEILDKQYVYFIDSLKLHDD